MQLNFNDLNINAEGNSNILKQGIYEKNNKKYNYSAIKKYNQEVSIKEQKYSKASVLFTI